MEMSVSDNCLTEDLRRCFVTQTFVALVAAHALSDPQPCSNTCQILDLIIVKLIALEFLENGWTWTTKFLRDSFDKNICDTPASNLAPLIQVNKRVGALLDGFIAGDNSLLSFASRTSS